MKILFLSPYPLEVVPSQRFRFEQYFCFLTNAGHYYSVRPFFQLNQWKFFISKGNTIQKIILLLSCCINRVTVLINISKYDRVFLHREAAPIGPPLFEWIICKVLGKKIIYDFDDAIWTTDRANESRLTKTVRWRSKVKTICKWSYKVSCGNEYLANYARRFNQNVFINPTTIDTVNLHNPDIYSVKKDSTIITIGWTGSRSTLKYLNPIEGVIKRLQKSHSNLNFHVIADQKPELNLDRMKFIPWNKETEVVSLLSMDIGIMPIPDDAWTNGKCGFKALQYMAMQIPCVASPIGVNVSIVDHDETGFLATTEKEWFYYLDKLITNADLRKKMGNSAREKVIKHYSVISNCENFLSLFE